MTTLSFDSILMYRVQADYGLVGRILCERFNLHKWTKWAPVSNVVKAAKGDVGQGRECIRCGYTQRRAL